MTRSSNLIRLEDVTKSFSMHRGRMLLRDHVTRFFRGPRRERFYALKHVSVKLERGESLALVGPNGAGKSTLLAVMAKLVQPDSGTVEVRGRMAALLELGLGFQSDLTGRENVSLNASLLGLSRKQTAARFDSIVDFSGIGDFIDEPLRTYSSGMVMRLAFAAGIHLDPDIVLIDEVLAVGDAGFQAKCLEKLREFRRTGTALVCVSHGQALVRELCESAVWLDHGEVVMTGAVGKVLEAYAGTPLPAPTD